MFVYLIIAAELAILYAVYWYIYLREPKPFTITGNPWGYYERGTERRFTADGIDLSLSIDKKGALKKNTLTRKGDYHHERRPHIRHSTSCRKLDKSAQKPKYGWVAEEPLQSKELIEQVLNALKSNVIELNVKVL